MTIQVQVINEDIGRGLYQLKKMVEQDGVLTELKLREKYPNASDRRRAKDRQAMRRRLKAIKKKENQRTYSLQSGVRRYASEGR